MNDTTNDIKSFLLKYFMLWVVAGLIVMFGNLLVVWLTRSHTELLTQLMTTAVYESIPFPFNLIVTWQLNPISLILQIIVFILLVVFIELLKSKFG